jgi:hypothetical protein
LDVTLSAEDRLSFNARRLDYVTMHKQARKEIHDLPKNPTAKASHYHDAVEVGHSAHQCFNSRDGHQKAKALLLS